MKRLLSTVLLTLALARPGFTQPAPIFINNGSITSPLVIDATEFENNGLFDFAFNSFSSNSVSSTVVFTTALAPFDFSDVLFYTNRDIMACDTGFIFDYAPSSGGSRQASTNFGNANLGQISAGSATNIFSSSENFFVGPEGLSLSGTPTLSIRANYIVNTGLLDVGVNGFIGLTGQFVNLDRGTVHIEGLDDLSSINSSTNIFFTGGALIGTSLDFGIFDEYWGVGSETNRLTAASFGVPPASDTSPSALVTNFPANPGSVSISPPLPEAFLYTNQIGASNFTYQVVFVNTNILANGINTAVRFAPGKLGFQIPVIQWSTLVTNSSTQTLTSNTLYLEDAFGTQTNLGLVTNGESLTGLPFPIPTNYTITRFLDGFSSLNTNNAIYDGTVFTNLPPVTNSYAALGVAIQPVTATPDPSSSVSSITNIPGRIEITASNSLDLTRAIVTGPNYLRLTATNHYVGSDNAVMIYPFADINLGSTNGTLTVSNLVSPYVPRFDGTIQAYSARWTNITATGITNEYHVLIVNAELQATSPVLLNTLSLRSSTNIFISDLLNVQSNLLLNAPRVTITSNACGAAIPTGQLSISNNAITWTPSFPVLQFLTNWGLISFPNTVYFAGVRQNPYFTSNFTEPYQALVNHGTISSSGVSIWANYFENTGAGIGLVTNCDGSVTNATNFAFFTSSFGPFNLQATNAVLANGGILVSFAGDINFTSGSLSISNHALLASGALTLTVTNVLTDNATSPETNNFWQVADGINLPILPAAGDLLGTTIDSTAPANLEVDNVWAGQDLGPTVNGFQNNQAVGHLILDGGSTTSVFFFINPDATNAIYVDLIELRDGATNRASKRINGQIIQTYTAIDVNPGMTVYFADAIDNEGDISEKLNGNLTESGGNVVWVPAYAGFFSSTNVTYPSGITYTLNRALVESADIDSSGTGTNNAFNPAPVFEGEDIKLSMFFTNNPGKSAVITWQTLANATNYLFTSTNLLSTNWSLISSFSTNVNERVSVTNSSPDNGPRYYRVRVDPPQP